MMFVKNQVSVPISRFVFKKHLGSVQIYRSIDFFLYPHISPFGFGGVLCFSKLDVFCPMSCSKNTILALGWETPGRTVYILFADNALNTKSWSFHGLTIDFYIHRQTVGSSLYISFMKLKLYKALWRFCSDLSSLGCRGLSIYWVLGRRGWSFQFLVQCKNSSTFCRHNWNTLFSVKCNYDSFWMLKFTLFV